MRRPFKIQLYIYYLVVAATSIELINSQATCNNGQARILYERLPNQQLQGFDDDVVRDTAPPFRVLEKCQDLCIRDKTVTNNLVRPCTSIDFQPGSRIASFGGNPEYEESTCYLTREQATPEGIGNLMLVPNSVHFTEVCLSSSRPERECPSRRYIFERYPRKKLKLPVSDMREITAANRTDCEDKCLNEFSFVCRSANYDVTLRSCTLSRFTRRTHPELLVDDPNSDYLENTCLNAERRCDGLVVFVKEESKKLGGPFEVEIFSNITLDECQSMCLRAEKYFCRSVEFDDHTKQCILSEEDSVSQKDDLSISSSPTHHFYDLVCLDNQRGTEYPDNSVTSHLFSNGRRPDTAFQRYRNSRLGGEFHSEITGRSLSECLDECLRQTSFQCRSAVYSDRFRTCRLSRYNQRDGMRIIYDADYDYYENLMLGSEGEHGSTKPDMDWHTTLSNDKDGGMRYPGMVPEFTIPTRFPERIPPGIPMRPNFPDRRFPTSLGPEFVQTIPTHMVPGVPDRYPGGRPDRYPGGGGRPGPDRYPSGGPERYPGQGPERYPSGGPDRYPSGGGDRYPSGGGDRYPDSGPERYPSGPMPERYPQGPPPRYPPNRFNEIDDRYPYPDDYDRDSLENTNKYNYGNRYPNKNRYGPNNAPPYDDGYYPDKQGMFPDTRNPPSRGHPVERPRYPDFHPPMIPPRPQYGPMPMPSYYEPDMQYNIRYPEPPENKYLPWSQPSMYETRFQIGMNRVPMDVYRYGNGRYPPAAMAGPPGQDDRYGQRGSRPGYVMVGFGGVPPESDGPYQGGAGSFSGPTGPIGIGTRCDEVDNYKQMGTRQRMRKQFIRRALHVPSLIHCQRECSSARDFICRSFNYKDAYENDRSAQTSTNSVDAFNCELSDRDTRELDVHSTQMFDTGNYDFYERHMSGRNNDDCLDVSQVCNEDGMEFTLRTNEPFLGRIYSYGFYDRCFFRGNGGSINVLRISGPQGFPECGTQKYGDTMTNIIVVQFSDHVQTGRDKRFNLTCLFRGPGESVVTSGYIGAGSGSPIPIEYLPAENNMNSKVQMYILYQGRPTTTIAVGDPLTFRLESVDQNHVNDIFATNVIARDPYSGKSVLLIDRYGCPVDTYVFPELGRSRDGDSLEARFNAFKIPESNFLVFEATVRTCKDGCQPAYCNGINGRSFGRKRRSINETILNSEEFIEVNDTDTKHFPKVTTVIQHASNDNATDSNSEKEEEGEELRYVPERVREMIEVFETREEMLQDSIARKMVAPIDNVCLSYSEYIGLITSVILLMILLVSIAVIVGVLYRKYWKVIMKNKQFSNLSPESICSNQTNYISVNKIRPNSVSHSIKNSNHDILSSDKSLFGGSSLQKTFATGNLARICQLPVINPINKSNNSDFDDPSEPIYSDVNLFERSRIQ